MNKSLNLPLFVFLFALPVLVLLTACNDRNKDLTPPVIDSENFLPANCDIYYAGDTITVHFTCSDDCELGNFNIEIHNNFDHHTHSTEAEDCEKEGHEEHTDGEEPELECGNGGWGFSRDYAIPANQTEYTADVKIPVPKGADKGDYHFMLRLTDKAGWQSIKSVALKLLLSDAEL